jgi:hypothetical protein
MAVRSGRATKAAEVVERRRGGAAWPVIWIVRRPGTPSLRYGERGLDCGRFP